MTEPSSRSPFLVSRRSALQALLVGSAFTRIARSAEPPYSIAVFPDEQYLARGGALYSELTSWVVDNSRALAPDGASWNIVGAIAVGDCVDAPGSTEYSGQCSVVREAYRILDDAGIPVISPPGNHDYVTDITNRKLSPNFQAGGVFSPSVRALHPGYGGSYDEDGGIPRLFATGANWWLTFSTGVRKILVIALEFCPRDAVMTWAKGVHDSMPDTECIVVTHAYLTDTGVQGNRTLAWGPATYGFAAGSAYYPTEPGRGFSGEEMWTGPPVFGATNPFRNWQNLTAIVSGHYFYNGADPKSRHYQRVSIRSDSVRGQLVHQFFCNEQDLDYASSQNGAGVCILRFDPAHAAFATYWMSRSSLKWSSDSLTFATTAAPLEAGISYPGIAAPATAPVIVSVVNGASYTTAIAQETWISILGTGLSHGAPYAWRAEDIADGVLPTELAGVRVNVNGRPAALSYVSATQISALAPADDSLGYVPLELVVNGLRSAPVMVELQEYAPGLLQWQGGAVVATHTDFGPAARPDVISGATPAAPGETIILWAIGLGKTVPPAPVGRVVQHAGKVVPPVLVHFESKTASADQEYVVSCPGFAGLYQIPVQIPGSLATGDISVWIEVAGVTSAAATLAVQRVPRRERVPISLSGGAGTALPLNTMRFTQGKQ